MRQEVQIVKDYWIAKSQHHRLDIETLENCVAALESDELKLLTTGDDSSSKYRLLMKKVLNRHNDALNGYTLFYHEKGNLKIRLSKNSSVTEVVDDNSVLKKLTVAKITRLKELTDNSKQIIDDLAFARIQEILYETPVDDFSPDTVEFLNKE